MFSRSMLGTEGKESFNLGCTLYDQKRYNEAEEHFQQAADRQERTLGQDHTDTLNSNYWLGHTLYNQKKYSEAKEQYRQVADRQERTLGQDHKDTLNSKYQLGWTLYDQKMYSKAEEQFRQVANRQERTLGQDHANTLNSKHRLGHILNKQKKYSEAEKQFRQAADRQERTLGQDHANTLSSKHRLGHTLNKRKKYSEATEQLQQAADGRERTLGQDHEDTLNSKHWLGHTLYNRKKYSKAEKQFQQAADRRERTLGQDHADTLNSKYWLGHTLYNQKKYSEAEEQFRQAADRWEKTLGQDHEGTLSSKHQLGYTFFSQKRYSKAEEQFRQTTDGRERTLGQDHKDTLDSKYWLGHALKKQKKYSEAEEQLRQIADRQERTLGQDHKDTLATVRSLQKLQLKTSLLLPIKDNTQQALAGRLESYFVEGQDKQVPYIDSEINEISTLLKHSNPHWSKLPRTYIILRIIGHMDVLENLISSGFSDYWFPVTERSLPGCLPPSVRAAVVSMQRLILTKSIHLEKSERGQHCYFEQGEPLPFEQKEILGNGGFGQVDKVLSLITFNEYARKRVLRSVAFRGPRKEHVQQFIAEIQILKRLEHQHIVKLIGSYTDLKYIGLIMSPVAEIDLGAYLKRATISNYPELRTFFGCLATALEFLHEQKVRYKDIKPDNILVDRGNVLFADFGLSLDFTDANGSTTTSMVNGMTYKYCAPEVARYERRNTMSDIWSLGVVFMEMIVVLKGRTVQYMNEFFSQHGSQQAFIRTNPDALLEFVVELEGTGELFDNRALGWAQQMLSTEQLSCDGSTI